MPLTNAQGHLLEPATPMPLRRVLAPSRMGVRVRSSTDR